MKSIELVPGIRSSVLGFGCAPILGSVDGKTARRAIDCAIDCGVTHFDLARSYGYGEAEAFVGGLLKGHRNQFVIASKFGIQANWKAGLLRPLKPIVRFVRGKRLSQTALGEAKSSGVTKVADRFHDRIPLRSSTMLQSVEKSLQALQMDYLDYLFIHEPHERVIHVDELFESAYKLKKEGKIRAFGLAFMNAQKPLHERYIDQFDVLQFDNPPIRTVYDALVEERGFASNVFFSPIKGGDLAMKPAEKIQLLCKDFPKSVVLCSMFKEEHVVSNCKLIG